MCNRPLISDDGAGTSLSGIYSDRMIEDQSSNSHSAGLSPLAAETMDRGGLPWTERR